MKKITKVASIVAITALAGASAAALTACGSKEEEASVTTPVVQEIPGTSYAGTYACQTRVTKSSITYTYNLDLSRQDSKAEVDALTAKANAIKTLDSSVTIDYKSQVSAGKTGANGFVFNSFSGNNAVVTTENAARDVTALALQAGLIVSNVDKFHTGVVTYTPASGSWKTTGSAPRTAVTLADIITLTDDTFNSAPVKVAAQADLIALGVLVNTPAYTPIDSIKNGAVAMTAAYSITISGAALTTEKLAAFTTLGVETQELSKASIKLNADGTCVYNTGSTVSGYVPQSGHYYINGNDCEFVGLGSSITTGDIFGRVLVIGGQFYVRA